MKTVYDKTILVTGGMGFIGSNFLNTRVPRYPNYLFVNIDALTYAANKRNLTIDRAPNYLFNKVDIRDQAALERIFKKFKPSGVIHFAAESNVDISIKNPHLFVETNVQGTHNLLFLALKYEVKRFHQISTDEVYGSLKGLEGIFTEGSPLAPNNPYSASKSSADLLVRAYEKTYGLHATITRCSNNYGPRQDTTKLIPRFIKNLLSGQQVPLYGTGMNVRDWIYVDDHVEAIDIVFHRGKKGEVYNVGGNCELTNMDLTKKLLQICGKDESSIMHVEDRKGHDFRYAIDSTKMKKEFGWEPKTKFDQGLAKTLAFYKESFNAKGRQ